MARFDSTGIEVSLRKFFFIGGERADKAMQMGTTDCDSSRALDTGSLDLNGLLRIVSKPVRFLLGETHRLGSRPAQGSSSNGALRARDKCTNASAVISGAVGTQWSLAHIEATVATTYAFVVCWLGTDSSRNLRKKPAFQAELILEGQTVTLEPGDSWLAGTEHAYRILTEFTAIEATAPPAQAHGRDE